jgi:intein/homing endonuclease
MNCILSFPAKAMLCPFHTPSPSMDSVTGDCTLYWSVGDQIKFGTMEDLFLSYNASEDKSLFKVLSAKSGPNTNRIMSAQNMDVCFADIKGVFYHGIKPVWKMTLHNGKTIGVTKDHSIFYGKYYDSQIEAIPLFELGERANVVSIDEYDLQIPSTSGYNNDFLAFMGLWMADGSYYKTYNKIDQKRRLYGVGISTGNNPAVIEWMTNFARKFPPSLGYKFGYDGRSLLSTSKKGDMCLVRKSLATIIFSMFGEVDSYTKRVPKFVFTESEQNVAAFLRGYFTGDGSVWARVGRGYYEVACASVNRELLEDISILLHRLVIKHVISEPYKNGKLAYPSKKLQYKLYIGDEHSREKFMNKVGFIKACVYKKRENFVGRHCMKGLRSISLRGIRKLEYVGEKPVYDISVAGTQAFIANGILCHNTHSGE